MSTILDALKRVEEQIRKNAEQKASAGPGAAAVPSPEPGRPPGQPAAIAAVENDEAMKVYLSLVGMLEDIQSGIETGQSESGARIAELYEAIAALQAELARQREADLKGVEASRAELAKAVAAMGESLAEYEAEAARQEEALRAECRQREAERDAANHALAATQSQMEPLRKTHAEINETIAKLFQAVAAAQGDADNNRDALREALQRLDADRDAAQAALTAVQSQLAALEDAHVEMLQTLEDARKDASRQYDELLESSRQSSADREAQEAAYAAIEASVASLEARIDALGKEEAEARASFESRLEGTSTVEALAKLESRLDTLGKAEAQAIAEITARVEKMGSGGAPAAPAESRVAESEDLIELRSRIEDLDSAHAQRAKATEELAQALALVQEGLARQGDVFDQDRLRRDVEGESARAGITAAQSQMDRLRESHAETVKSASESAALIAALSREVTALRGTMQKESKKRSAKREADEPRETSQPIAPELLESVAQLGRLVAEVQSGLAVQREKLQQEAAQWAARFAALAETQAKLETAMPLAEAPSQDEAMRELAAETRKAIAELQQAAETGGADSAQQVEVLRREAERNRNADREAANAALAGVQAQADAARDIATEIRDALAELRQEMQAAHAETAQQLDTFRHEMERNRDADREAAGVAMRAALEASERSIGGLAEALSNVREELERQGEASRGQSRAGDVEREKAAAALDAMRAKMAMMAQTLATLETLHHAELTKRTADDWQYTPEESPAAKVKPATVIDKFEAQRLHAAAGEAFSARNFAEALRLLDLIDASFPNNKSILYNRAECLLNLGRNDEARALCDRLVSDLYHAPAAELKNRIPA